MKICEEPRFVEIFKMIRGFFLKWTGSCRTCGNTQEFFVCSLSRLSPVVNRNGRKDGGQH